MRLKRVKIFGFKTFADRTDLDLEGDLIAVVGPNGCGKSNIVDAILWALGEPNARHLRAATSQEIIFCGSSSRKALGYAEVTLLFDNEDGALAIDLPEVSVSRRLTRSGDSDFCINGRSCRLKDVYDLFADSGLGRSGYAIVGQKEIDAALAASAEDRRAWVDEAAGVQRYRARRKDSLSRLEAAKDHLSRVQDILLELELQREPLRAEAARAKQYQTISESLREIESGLLCIEIAGAVHELAIISENSERCQWEARKKSEEADCFEKESVALGNRISELETDMDRIREERQAALTAAERADAELKLCEQKLQSIHEFEQNLNEETVAGEIRLDQARLEMERATRETLEAAQVLASLESELNEGCLDAKEIQIKLSQVETEVLEGREEQKERQGIAAEQSHRSIRLSQISEEIVGIQRAVPDLESGIAQADASLKILEEQLAVKDGAARTAEDAANALRARQNVLFGQIQTTLAEIAVLEGRKRGLEATIEMHEGLAQGARAILDLVAKGELPGAFRAIVDCIDVDGKYALAIETALGNSANDLVCENEAQAQLAIDKLKVGRLGRATFQPLSLMKPTEEGTSPSVLKSPGVLGMAADLLTCELTAQAVIVSLLARVIVAEDLPAALALASTSEWAKIVTLDGEILFASGAVTGGNSARQATGLIQRKADVAHCTAEIAALTKTLVKFESDLAHTTDEIVLEEAALNLALTSKSDLENEADEARRWLASLKQGYRDTLKSQQRLESEAESLRSPLVLEAPKFDLKSLEKERDRLLQLLAGRAASQEGFASRMDEARARQKQFEKRRIDAVHWLEEVTRSEQKRSKRLAGIEEERARVRRRSAEEQVAKTTAEERQGNLQRQLEAFTKAKRDLLEQSLGLTEAAKRALQAAALCADSAHQAEISRARTDAKRSNALERLLEEYGLSQEDALVEAPSIRLPADAASMASRHRRDLKALGIVNLGAIEAYDRLTERYSELAAQQDDILAAKAEVEAGIRELDKLTRDRFRDTFHALQIAFETTFARLFGGGEGKLLLTDDEDLLVTGVEVEVTVPGKKKQRLELLSGGERALAACAFLFALLKVKPCPLVILDEVDAPLDGRNVERFIEILDDYKPETQFILITHNPVTIEAAPLWFGVTMKEPGVSVVIPCRAPLAHHGDEMPMTQAALANVG